jgi:hypothetical protein
MIASTEGVFMKLIFALLSIALVTGCATSGGFWAGVTAKRDDKNYYLGRYVGTEKGCFPPITNRRCDELKRNEVIYEADRQLEIESFSISSYSDGFFAQSRAKDKVYLAASELALQRGFSMFTVITNYEDFICTSGRLESITTGEISPGIGGSGTSFSASTTAESIKKCGGSIGISVLFFKDKSDLAKGILYMAKHGSEQWLVPETSLYFGTIPNLRASEYNYSQLAGARTTTENNAWKTHFDAKGLSADLRKKYQLTDVPPISFKDEAAENIKRKARESEEPLTKRRITDQ